MGKKEIKTWLASTFPAMVKVHLTWSTVSLVAYFFSRNLSGPPTGVTLSRSLGSVAHNTHMLLPLATFKWPTASLATNQSRLSRGKTCLKGQASAPLLWHCRRSTSASPPLPVSQSYQFATCEPLLAWNVLARKCLQATVSPIKTRFTNVAHAIQLWATRLPYLSTTQQAASCFFKVSVTSEMQGDLNSVQCLWQKPKATRPAAGNASLLELDSIGFLQSACQRSTNRWESKNTMTNKEIPSQKPREARTTEMQGRGSS